MTKGEWKKRIEQAAQDAGTYQPFFDDMINTLAGIMENRDRSQEMFEKSGGNPVITHTNKGGATNIVKHPALVMVNDLNATALTYWRDLGLTPKGFSMMQKNGFKPKESTFEDLLEGIGI